MTTVVCVGSLTFLVRVVPLDRSLVCLFGVAGGLAVLTFVFLVVLPDFSVNRHDVDVPRLDFAYGLAPEIVFGLLAWALLWYLDFGLLVGPRGRSRRGSETVEWSPSPCRARTLPLQTLP